MIESIKNYAAIPLSYLPSKENSVKGLCYLSLSIINLAAAMQFKNSKVVLGAIALTSRASPRISALTFSHIFVVEGLPLIIQGVATASLLNLAKGLVWFGLGCGLIVGSLSNDYNTQEGHQYRLETYLDNFAATGSIF